MEISVLKVPKTLKIELLYSTAILLLSLNKKNIVSQGTTHTYTVMFITAFFVILKLWA